ncbi:hypothetical protein HaLaN_26012 [Haematococcus lacustris]|uniref:Uncharacterized protein n=1 Tax=Haematococcus lacustris TaxID=44745 RepID=A0A6A0A579_HAELA|nr:hypothetical protein HaLaN_26012 [Haematococcus lacustris]
MSEKVAVTGAVQVVRATEAAIEGQGVPRPGLQAAASMVKHFSVSASIGIMPRGPDPATCRTVECAMLELCQLTSVHVEHAKLARCSFGVRQ